MQGYRSENHVDALATGLRCAAVATLGSLCIMSGAAIVPSEAWANPDLTRDTYVVRDDSPLTAT
jgi:hypothetical protein